MSSNPPTDSNLFGDIDYALVTSAVAFTKSGKPLNKTVQLQANQTVEESYDLPKNKVTLLSVQIVATAGTTGTEVSIHEDTNYDNTDQVYRATGVSINDSDPTGGPVGNGDGIPYVDLTQSDKLHVQISENSGTAGAILLRIKYI